MYQALGCDFEKFSFVKQLMCTAGLCTSAGHVLTLTAKGVDLAKQADEFAKKGK